jgi:hypothetical protein
MGKQVAADFDNGEGRYKERWDGMAGDEGVTGDAMVTMCLQRLMIGVAGVFGGAVVMLLG